MNAWATLEEFLRRLRLDNPTPEAEAVAQQALDAAAEEINAYLGYSEETPPPVLSTQALALLAVVNLDRAGEHWRYTPYGTLPQGPELAPVLTARDSFERHRRKLAPLKTSWGIA